MLQLSYDIIYSFYKESNFLYKEKEEFLKDNLEVIKNTWNQLINSPKIFKFFYTTNNQNELKSSIAFLEYLPSVWMTQHAVSKNNPKGLLKNLRDVYKEIVINNDIKYVRMIYRPNNKWPKRVFGPLEQILTKEEYFSEEYNYFIGTYQKSQINFIKKEGPITVNFLEQKEEDKFIKELEKVHNNAFIHSKGLHNFKLTSENIKKTYQRFGLNREYNILIAKQHDKIIGYSILDFSSLALNFSYLVNSFTLKMFEQNKKATELLINNSIYYYIYKKRKFVVALSNEDKETFKKYGLDLKKRYYEFTFLMERDELIFNQVKKPYNIEN